MIVGMCVQANAEEVKVADARVHKETESDKFVVFLSKRLKETGPGGDIILAVGKGDAPENVTIEAAFGLRFENGRPTMGKVPAEHITTLRASEEGQPTKAFFARVDADIYDIALKQVKDAENGVGVTKGIPPTAQTLEAIRVMMPSLSELKPPYLGSPMQDPQVWMEDLFVLNRKK